MCLLEWGRSFGLTAVWCNSTSLLGSALNTLVSVFLRALIVSLSDFISVQIIREDVSLLHLVSLGYIPLACVLVCFKVKTQWSFFFCHMN